MSFLDLGLNMIVVSVHVIYTSIDLLRISLGLIHLRDNSIVPLQFDGLVGPARSPSPQERSHD